MKKFILVIFLFFFSLNYNPIQAASNDKLPCTLILNSVKDSYTNAKGVALIYKVQLFQSFPRTSISIHGVHLPNPPTLGDYDTYEGFAFVPEVISWRFKLYPTSEATDPTWAGKIDDITMQLDKSTVEIRLSNSKSGKLGPPVLINRFSQCK